ncbi:hypothetical protein V6Z11_A10G209700 [Gossypium hirsutum]
MDGVIIFVGGVGGMSNSFNLLLIVFFAVDMSVHSLLFDELEPLYSSSSEDAGFNDFAIYSSFKFIRTFFFLFYFLSMIKENENDKKKRESKGLRRKSKVF